MDLKPTDDELVACLHNLEVSANSVACCYTRVPGNFARALTILERDAEQARILVERWRETKGRAVAAAWAEVQP